MRYLFEIKENIPNINIFLKCKRWPFNLCIIIKKICCKIRTLFLIVLIIPKKFIFKKLTSQLKS